MTSADPSPSRLTPVLVSLPDYGAFVLESHHAAGFRMAPSSHDFLEVFYVLHGGGTFVLDGDRHEVSGGDVVAVPPGHVHVIEDDPGRPMSLYGVCVAPRIYRINAGVEEPLPPGRLSLARSLAERVRTDLRRMLFEQTVAGTGSPLVIVGLAVRLLGLLARGHNPDALPERQTAGHLGAVRRYVADLRHRFFEPADLGRTTDALGMSRRRFTHLFREVTGTSWLEHLTGLRIDYACRLLRETERSISAIAFEAGFEDLSSFYRCFKRRVGLSPGEWRRNG